MRILILICTLSFSMGCSQDYSCEEIREMSVSSQELPILTEKDAVNFAVNVNKKFHKVVHDYTFDYWSVKVSQKNSVWEVNFCSRRMEMFNITLVFTQEGDLISEHLKTWVK